MILYKAFSIYDRLTGWEYEYKKIPKDLKKGLIIAAPHTSNWDFVRCLGAFNAFEVPTKFAIKDDWMRFPLNLFMGPLGGIGVDRSPREGLTKRESLTQSVIDLYNNTDELYMVFTPEGSRSKRTHWKTGFYHIAKGANVPLMLAYADYKNKIVGFKDCFMLTDDKEADMRKIMQYYNYPEHARYPEDFSVDTRYI